MVTNPHAFLFDADVDGIPSYYGGYFDSAFLSALSVADPKGKTCSRVRRGDARLDSLAERTEAVSSSPSRSSHTIGHDMPLYKSLVWDLADVLSSQWHTLDLTHAPMTIANHNIHCITLNTLPIDVRGTIHHELADTNGYLGGFEIDPGNPVQRRAFAERLVYDAAVIGGQVVRELGYEGDRLTPFDGAEKFIPNGAIWRPHGWLRTSGPPDLPSVPLSERGKRTDQLLTQKRKDTLEDRVIDALARLPRHDRSAPEYFFEAVTTDYDILQAILPEGKFTEYLFDRNHKRGGSKAKFFVENLGIAPEDWRFLAAQFYEGLKHANPQRLRIEAWDTGYGARFEINMPVVGRNGQTGCVKTVWQITPGARPSLITAHPAEKANSTGTVTAPPIVSADLSGGEKWVAVFELAHAAGVDAATNAIPTPMKLMDGPFIEEGECGSALVRVADARTGFARWLLRTERGQRHYQGGACVYSSHPSQSIDRARAYAQAFAAVLELNGIPSTIETYYT